MNITASLQIKNNIYQVVLNYKDINGKRKQKWVSTGLSEKGNNKRLANQKMQEILSDFKETMNCTTSKNNEKLFTLYLKEWLLDIKNTIEENTYDSYKVIVNKTCDYFEDKNILLNELKPADIQKFYTYLYSKELTGNTVLHYHNLIRKAFQTALRLDLILSNPADRVERPKKEQFIGSFYFQTELNTLFSLIKDDPLKIVIYLASFYGLRRSEVLGLKWDAFDFENKTITIKHKAIQGKEDDILRKIRFHDLRHSCASLLLAKEIPMKEIQDWLGHSTYSTTANIYAHLEKNTKNKSANVLSNTLTFADA